MKSTMRIKLKPKDINHDRYIGVCRIIEIFDDIAEELLIRNEGHNGRLKEYKELEYRILCTQLYQQNEIDKIKGIVAKPMAKYWYSYKDCPNEYQKSICCEKKPYFMIYRYEKEKTEYRKFIKDNNAQCISDYGIDIKTLLTLPYDQLTEEQKNTVKWYNKFNPVDMNLCTINKICYYIESVIKDYKSTFKERVIDYSKFKVKRRCTQEHKDKLKELMEVFITRLKHCVETNTDFVGIKSFSDEYFQERAQEICPNDDERRNIILDLCYGDNHDKSNKEFCWTVIADMILKERGYE